MFKILFEFAFTVSASVSAVCSAGFVFDSGDCSAIVSNWLANSSPVRFFDAIRIYYSSAFWVELPACNLRAQGKSATTAFMLLKCCSVQRLLNNNSAFFALLFANCRQICHFSAEIQSICSLSARKFGKTNFLSANYFHCNV